MGRLSIEVEDQLLAWFAQRAKRIGHTEEQLARSIIEREARSEQTLQTLEDNSSKVRERMKSIAKYESTARIPRHTDQ